MVQKGKKAEFLLFTLRCGIRSRDHMAVVFTVLCHVYISCVMFSQWVLCEVFLLFLLIEVKEINIVCMREILILLVVSSDF